MNFYGKFSFLFIPAIISIIPWLSGMEVGEELGKSTRSSNPLKMLYFVPRHQFNKSHANFAISIAKVLKRKQSVRIIVPHIHDGDKFDQQTTAELGIEYYKFGRPAETAVPTDDKKAPILKHVMQAQRQFWFELATVMIKDKDFMDKLYEEKFDVGVSEWIADNTFAFLIFHALNLPYVINTKAFSPNTLELMSLGLTEHYIKNNIPINEEDITVLDGIRWRNSYRTKFGDHREKLSKRRQRQIAQSYARDIKRKQKRYGEVDKAFRELSVDLFPAYRDLPEPQRQQKGPFPGLEKMFEKSSFFLVNTVPQIEFDAGAGLMLRSEKVKMIGGVNLQLEKKPKKLTEFGGIANKLMGIKKLDGIVLISFGTVYGPLTRLPDHEFSVVLNAINSLPSFLFIWQMPTEDERAAVVNELTNAYTAAWVPQPAILADTRTKAFVSHCGRNSQIEAAYFGVPLVCVPRDADQLYNAESTARQRLGVVLDRKCMDPKTKNPNTENPNRVTSTTCFTQSAFKRALDVSINRSAPPIDGTAVQRVSAELQERRIPDIILEAAKQIADKKAAADNARSRTKVKTN